MARAAAIAAVVVMTLCVAALTVGYVQGRIRAPREAQQIKDFQLKVQMDSSYAPKLAEFHKQITETLAARKARHGIIAIILIAACGIFIASAKWLISRHGVRTPDLETLVQLKAPPLPAALGSPPPSKRRSKRTEPAPESTQGPDLAYVDEIIAAEGGGKEAAIQILQGIQTHYRYLPEEALKHVCEVTEVTPAQIAGTSSFYAQFRRTPVGKHVVRVCHGTACHVAGARQITDELRRYLEIPQGADTDADRMFTLDEVACLGCCSLAPVLTVGEHTVGRLTPSAACGALDTIAAKEPA